MHLHELHASIYKSKNPIPVFFVRSLSLKVCDRNSSGLWRLESVKFHQFVVC